MDAPLESLTASAVEALEALPRSVSDLGALPDSTLVSEVAVAARLQRLASTHAALLAGEVARRSARVLGGTGLAQRSGFRTPEELVRVTTGSTRAEASQSVRIGSLAHDPSTDAPQQPWLRPVSSALFAGTLSSAAADAIRAGLGVPSPSVSSSELLHAAASLSSLALDADQLYRRAREQRDALDEAGIADREAQLRSRRSFRLAPLPDGMTRATWLLDPESAAAVSELFDRATSPRRGGPRFVSAENAALAAAVEADPRTTEQLASDVFLELVRQGAAADSTRLLSSGAPVVRALVTAPVLESRRGHGFLEGQSAPVSVETIERLVCGGAVQHVTVDAAGQPLALGREQRLFSRHQRVALAIRDGGCRWPGCDRPPSWTEAHHTRHWARDEGATDVSNGILLCRHHHLLLHNNHWQIRQRGAVFWLVPPPEVDAARVPRETASKSPLARERELARDRESARERERVQEREREQELALALALARDGARRPGAVSLQESALEPMPS